jgi:hypothetical protein
MEKFVFVTLIVTSVLTAGSLSATMGEPAANAGNSARFQREARAAAPTWTCVHNTYRSVACR